MRVIDSTEVIVYKNTQLVVPKSLQAKVVQWHHHYLMHPGHTSLEDTIAATMYWHSLQSDVRRHVKSCPDCQSGKKHKLKYGILPAKIIKKIPW